MGKNGKQRKKRRLEQSNSSTAAIRIPPSSFSMGGGIKQVLASKKIAALSSDSDNNIGRSDSSSDDDDDSPTGRFLSATSVLKYFAQNLDEYHKKQNKAMRKAIFPLFQAQQQYNGGEFDFLLNDDDDDNGGGGRSFKLETTKRSIAAAEDDDGAVPSHPPSELKIIMAVETITELAEQQSTTAGKVGQQGTFFSPELTPLRQALIPLIRDYETTNGKLPSITMLSINARVSQHFERKDWHNLLLELRSMEIHNYLPKLGALQRWVRECDNVLPQSVANLISYQIMRISKFCRELHEPAACKKPMQALISRGWGTHLLSNTRVIQEFIPRLQLTGSEAAGKVNALDLARQLTTDIARRCQHIQSKDLLRNDSQNIINNNNANNRTSADAGDDYNYHSNCLAGNSYFAVKRLIGADRRPPSELDMYIYASAPNTISFSPLISVPSSAASPMFTLASKAETTTTTTAPAAAPAATTTEQTENQNNLLLHLKPSRIDVPGVDGAFALQDVLTPLECAQLIASAECLGYTPDAVEGIDALVWVADETLVGPIFERVASLLPQRVTNIVGASNAASAAAAEDAASAVGTTTTTNVGKNKAQEVAVLAGLNPRLRFFRYKAGSVYHPHIDGSWKAGGFDSDGFYKEELNPDLCSRYTFLMYLNGGFEGGGTTFFGVDEESSEDTNISTLTQDIRGEQDGKGERKECTCIFNNKLCKRGATSEGGGGEAGACSPAVTPCTHSIKVRSVQPQQGSVLCFPHGRAAGALVHEGSAVGSALQTAAAAAGADKSTHTQRLSYTDDGIPYKYVIRTDILFRIM